MASSGFDRQSDNVTKTRLQEKAEKRRTDDEIRLRQELKRKKNMFEPRKLIGANDLLVNSNLPKIKLEDDFGCSLSPKQEHLEFDSTSTEATSTSFADSDLIRIKQEVSSNLFAEEEEIMDESIPTKPSSAHYEQTEAFEDLVAESDIEHKITISELENNDEDSRGAFETKQDEISQNHVDQLKVFISQKEEEIKLLIEVIKGMQLQLHVSDNILSDLDVENEQFVLIDDNINKCNVIQGSTSENARVIANLTSDLMEKHAKIRILTIKMLKLQDKMFGTANYDLETSKNYKTSGDFVQESFKMVLPFLYSNLQLNDILRCRIVCRSWQSATDVFLKDHPSTMTFDKKTHLEEIGKLKHGRMPIWNESPLKKLANAYRFSNIAELKKFNNDQQGTIVGSTICLDTLIPTTKINMNTVARFLKIFGIHIKSLVIRHNIDLPDCKFGVLLNFVRLCLSKVLNVQHFKLVFCIDKEKLKNRTYLDALEAMANKEFSNHWLPGALPELQQLESLEFDVEISEERSEKVNFLQNFCKRLVLPYSKQLKQLSICTSGIDPSDCLTFPSLVQLSVPQRELYKIEFICQHVEKCTITGHPPGIISKTISTLKTMFPKLSCLGFKHEDVGEQFYHRYLIPCSAPGNYDPSFPKLSGVQTLELENCGAITFIMLESFPNLQYIKLVNKYTTNQIKYSKHPSLEITKLCNGLNLYKSNEFWENFHNILLVALEFSCESSINIKPKLCRWTREGYARYCSDNFLEEILQI